MNEKDFKTLILTGFLVVIVSVVVNGVTSDLRIAILASGWTTYLGIRLFDKINWK